MKTVCVLLFVGVLSSITYGKGDKKKFEYPDDYFIPDEVNQRILKGRPAKVGEFPYQVALRQPGRPGGLAFCGGSIVDRHWVLTAAHCFWGLKKGGLSIGLKRTVEDVEVIPGGVTDLDSQQARDVAFPVEKIHVHRYYNKARNYNDIALLKIGKDPRFPERDLLTPKAGVTPDKIQLANGTNWKQINDKEEDADVTGYGWTRDGAGKGSRYLLHTTIPIQPDDKCSGGWFASLFKNYRKDIMICAGILEAGHNACHADSGGPLVVKDKDSRRVQVGVVSYGSGKTCGAANIPTVYARVSKFYDYIHDVINGKIIEGKKESEDDMYN